MNPCAQSSSPISPVTTGTCAATLSTSWRHAVTQPGVPYLTNLYVWSDATSWCSGSDGSKASQWERSPAQPSPPSMSGCVAPVERTAVTSDCIPAVVQPPVVQPFFQHFQLTS